MLQRTERHIITNSKPHEQLCFNAASLTYIYALISPINNKIRYIGKADNPKVRYNKHLSECIKRRTYKECWIYGLLEMGIKPILKIIECIPMEKWEERETYWIKYYKTTLTNIQDGGGFSPMKNIETIEKMRKSLTGKIMPNEVKMKISNSLKGRIITKEHKNKMSQSWQSRKNNYSKNDLERLENFKKVNIGRKHSEKTKKIKSKQNSGSGNPNYGKKCTDYCKQRTIEINSKKVKQYDKKENFIHLWDSSIEASCTLNINKGSICNCLNNRTNTAGGFIWKFAA